MSSLFAEPLPVSGPESCRFYHTLDLPASGLQHGAWDLRGRFDEYTAHVPLSGKTVLDVGTASGFLTFEAEKRGANVVSVEAVDLSRWQRLPFAQSLAFTNRAEWEIVAADHLDGVKRSYWLAHKEFGSQARAHYGDVYHLPETLGHFDVAIVAQILVHLRDVIEAITSVSRRCAKTLIITEGMDATDEPLSKLIGRANRPDLDYAFWHHSVGLYREVLAMLGFTLKHKHPSAYRCNVEGNPIDTPITTLVFERVAPLP